MIMRDILYVVCLLATFLSCGNSNQSTCANQVDTVNINTQLLLVVKEYIKENPGYKAYSLLGDVILQSQYEYLSDEYFIFVIAPAVDVFAEKEHYGKKRMFPYNYFLLDNKIVYIASSCDALVNQKKVKNLFNSSIIGDKEKRNSTWVISVSPYGNVRVLTKNSDEMCGVRKVENSIKFDAPKIEREHY